MGPVNVAIIYYSATGTVHALAQAVVEGAEKAGAHVRLRKIAETAPPDAISAKPEWAQHLQDTADVVEAGLDDLEWAGVSTSRCSRLCTMETTPITRYVKRSDP